MTKKHFVWRIVVPVLVGVLVLTIWYFIDIGILRPFGTTTETASQQDHQKSLPVQPVNQQPIVDFTYTPTSPLVDQPVYFTDESYDPDGKIISWNWNFGDGLTSNARNPSHGFISAGDINVCLTVVDNQGASAIKCNGISISRTQVYQPPTNNPSQPVNPPPNQPPVSDFTYYPANPIVNQAVQFTDGSYDPDGSIVSWNWSLGDGSSSNLRNPTAYFSSAGNVRVCLTVTDNQGDARTKCTLLSISSLQPSQPPQQPPQQASPDQAIFADPSYRNSDSTIVATGCISATIAQGLLWVGGPAGGNPGQNDIIQVYQPSGAVVSVTLTIPNTQNNSWTGQDGPVQVGIYKFKSDRCAQGLKATSAGTYWR